jgi:ABC-2 type transport system ATP-binding protein
MENAIELLELTKVFGDVTAVDHIDLQIRTGEIFGFLGPNGAGKTTTLRMLVGLTTPSDGTATIKGYDILKDMVKVKHCVGMVPETSNLYNELTVSENLRFMAGMYHVPKIERANRIGALLKTFGLTDRREVKFGILSKGLKRRVTIAAALIHNPDILFLDEPTSGLDVMSARSLRQFLKDLQDTGVTVFLTTHYIEEADQLCDRIAIIVKGRIITVDTPENLKTVVQDTSIIEIRFTSLMDSLNLDELKNYGRVKIKNNTLWLQVSDVSEALTALTNFTNDHSLEVAQINTVKPSLEDAFVQLTGVEPEVMLMEKELRGRRA